MKKRAAVSMDREQLSKAARTEALSDTRRLEDTPFLRCRTVEDEEAEMERIVRARKLKEGVVLPLLWENPNVMVYVKLGAKHLDTRRFGALPSHGRSSKNIYEGRFCATVHGAWRLRQEEWETVKEYTEERMDMPVLGGDLGAVFATNLVKFASDG